MSTLVTVVVSAIVGVALAVSAAVGIVVASQQTPSNTATVQQPLYDYGNR
jgi:hypothetical protein